MTPAHVRSEFLLWPGSTIETVEAGLDRFLPPVNTAPEPLHRAMRYAVFSGGKRLRPQLLLQVAQACGIEAAGQGQELALRAACAVELLHIASLVHDDLPCFDDASERRGRPTVHVLFGEATAVLVGDALLAHSFDVLAKAPRPLATRALRLVRLLVGATASYSGLIGGQGMEQQWAQSAPDANPSAWSSPEIIDRYHRMKTGVLFGMAAEAAAVAAGSNKVEGWREVGNLFGRWYQLGHDLLDMRKRAALAAKSQAAMRAKALALGPPNAVLARGEASVMAELQAILAQLQQSVQALAEVPEPMLAFLIALRDRMLQDERAEAAKK